MIVTGLSRVASTSRSLNCPADQRDPAPDRSGANVPWNRSSAKGPVWHNRQAPSRRSTTSARPAAGSPVVPVSDSGIASSTTLWGWSASSSAACANSAHTTITTTALTIASGKCLGRDRAEPSRGIARFEGAEVGRGIGRADPTRALDIDQLSVDGMVDAGDGDSVTGCHQTVAGVDQPGRRRYLVIQQ